jgi:hypothetical protein
LKVVVQIGQADRFHAVVGVNRMIQLEDGVVKVVVGFVVARMDRDFDDFPGNLKRLLGRSGFALTNLS